VLLKLPIKMSAGLGLSLVDRAVKESFAVRCKQEDLERIRHYFLGLGALRCLYCGSGNPDRWDHLHAVSRGGDTVPGNLVPACQRCDDSKQDKDVDEWAKGQSKHRPPLEYLPRIQAEVRAYQAHFSHEPREFEEKLSADELAKYKRFRREIDALRAHLKAEGLLK
jgi:5-methylcytosine-specific restriction endonuclease McrA